MILHIFNDQKKFSKVYFKMLKDAGWDMSNFHLAHFGSYDNYFEELGVPSFFISNFFTPIGIKRLYTEMTNAKKIIVHSLASPYLLWIIARNTEIANKVYWVIWGKDLYFYHSLKKVCFYHTVYESLRKKAIRNIKHIIPIIHEDFELAQHWYDVQANEIECNSLYPYALDFNNSLTSEQYVKKSSFNVLLGNSASYTNNHIDALYWLKKHEKSVEKIYCPLSYNGSERYKKNVLATGRELFDDKFVGLTSFLPKEEYFKILQVIDIGFFNHDRQEALGNIYSLLLNGKTTYLKGETSSYKFFIRHGIKIKDIDTVQDLSPYSCEINLKNGSILRPLIDLDASLAVWKKILL